MRKLLVLFAYVPLLCAQTSVAIRNGAGSGIVTGVSNDSPPRVTVSSDPGWQTGDLVVFANHLIDDSGIIKPSPINGARYVVRVSATTYDLHSAGGSPPSSPLAAPGVWTSSTNPWAGKAVLATLPAARPRMANDQHRRAFRRDTSDGLTNIVVSGGTATATLTSSHGFVVGGPIGVWGSATTALNTATATVSAVSGLQVSWATSAGNGTYTDAAISERANTANPAWVAMQTSCNAAIAAAVPPGGSGTSMEAAPYWSCAMIYHIDRSNTAARDAAKAAVAEPSWFAAGSLYCDESRAFCGLRYQSVDYSTENYYYLSQVFDFLMSAGALDSTEQTNYLNRTENTNIISGQSCTIPTPVDIGGVSISGTTITRTSGTYDFSTMALGGAIWITSGGIGTQAGDPFLIRSRTSTTATTHVSSGQEYTTGTSGTGMYVRPWQAGDCGLVWYWEHHQAGVLGDQKLLGASTVGTIRQLPSYADGWYQNLHGTRAIGETGGGFIAADLDARAKYRLEGGMAITWDTSLAVAASTFGGTTQYGSAYLIQRAWHPLAQNIILTRLGLGMDGDWSYKPFEALWRGWNGASMTSGAAYSNFSGEGTLPMNGQLIARGVYSLSQNWPTAYRRRLLHLWKQMCGGAITTTCLSYNQTRGAAPAYWGLDPHEASVDYTSDSLSAYVRSTNTNQCDGAEYCLQGEDYRTFYARSSWAHTSAKLYVGGPGRDHNDHQGPEASNESFHFDQVTAAVQAFIAGGDSGTGAYWATGAGSDSVKNMLTFSHLTRKNTLVSSTSAATRLFTDGNADYAHVRVDSRNGWTVQPTLADSDFLMVLGSEPMIFRRTSTNNTSGIARYYTHYVNNGQASEGTTTCGGSACTNDAIVPSGLIWSDDTTRRMISSVVYPDSARRGIRWVDSTWTGRTGNTMRVTTCATANDTTCGATTGLLAIEARRWAPVASGTTFNTTALSTGFWGGVQATGLSSTVVAMFADGNTATSMPAVTTSAAAKLVAVGFAPGTYKVQVGGVDVPGCSGITVTSTDGSVYCSSVPSGSVTVVSDSGGPSPIDITTTSVPSGTVGVPYSQALTITGGTPAYVCSVVSGSLPSGLSISSGGVIAGTPTNVGTSVFTISCTDSLSASPDTAALTIQIFAAPASGNPVTLRNGVLLRTGVAIR